MPQNKQLQKIALQLHVRFRESIEEAVAKSRFTIECSIPRTDCTLPRDATAYLF
jgi:hypothetical protein